ncbi:MAG: EthD family reductase [Blastococcus sp.]
MFKAVILLRRRPGTTHEEFLMSFRLHMRPLIQQLPGVCRITVSDAIAGPGGRPAYDGMAELWFDDIDAVRRLIESPQAADAEAAMADFADMQAYETFLTVEHPGIDGAELVEAVRDAGVDSRIVVFTRDNYRPRIAAAFRAAGADAFVAKTALVGFETACRGRSIWPTDC